MEGEKKTPSAFCQFYTSVGHWRGTVDAARVPCTSSLPPRRLCYANADGCGRFAVIFHPPVTRDKRRVTRCRYRASLFASQSLTSSCIVLSATFPSRSPFASASLHFILPSLKLYAFSLGPRRCEIKMLGALSFLAYTDCRCICV